MFRTNKLTKLEVKTVLWLEAAKYKIFSHKEGEKIESKSSS